MRKKIASFLALSCYILLMMSVKISTAQEASGLGDGGSNIPCFSTYRGCTWMSDCYTSVKCSTCTDTNMKDRADRGTCNNCGCGQL